MANNATGLTAEQKQFAIDAQNKHWTHAEIGAELGFSRCAITKFLCKHNRNVSKCLIERSAGTKARQVGQLENLASQAYRAWERSEGDREGDPAYLREVRGALADVREILGIGRTKEPIAPPLRDALTEAEARDGSYQPARPPSANEDGTVAGTDFPVP